MIKDKYYTPTIEEFYVGFEFESNYVLFQKGNKGDVWNKHILTQEELWFWDSWKHDAVDAEFRVKYLDQEDIESLGFITYDDTTFDKGDLQIRFNCLLQKKGQGLGLIIYDRYSGIIFTGYIKNKSELIKLFKQLDINE
jgi:hypothetical protein